MANITVTYASESPGNSITSTKWNANFSDITNGLSDGSKTVTISALVSATVTAVTIAGTPNFSGAVTFASTIAVTGAATFAGNVTLGNAVGDTTTVTGELAGAVLPLCYSDVIATSNGDQYMNPTSNGSTFAIGFKMPKAGSVVFASLAARAGTFASNAVFKLEVHKNGVSVYETAEITVAATGTNYGDTVTQARGTDTFSVGDYIAAYLNYSTAGNASLAVFALIGVQFDT